MIEITGYHIDIRGVSYGDGMLVATSLKCPKCHEIRKVKYLGQKFYCKRCDSPLEVNIVGDKSGMFSWKNKCTFTPDNLGAALDNLRSREQGLIEEYNLRLHDALKGLNSQVHDLNEKIRELEEEKRADSENHEAELQSLREDHDRKLAELEETATKSERDLADRTAELSQWKESYSQMVEKVRNLKKENESLEETNVHYRNVAAQAEAFSLRDIAGYFLDYATAIYNAAREKEKLEDLKNIIAGRTEYLQMILLSRGLEITHHEPGSELGSGRADIEVRPTDDPKKDCKVIRSDLFGCRFKNDIYPEIPEKVLVYQYVKPEVPENPVTEEPAVTAQEPETPAEPDATPAEEPPAEVPEDTVITEEPAEGNEPEKIPESTDGSPETKPIESS